MTAKVFILLVFVAANAAGGRRVKRVRSSGMFGDALYSTI
jgi:hypothetical protein